METSEFVARFEEELDRARCELSPSEYLSFLGEVWDLLLAYAPEPPWPRSED